MYGDLHDIAAGEFFTGYQHSDTELRITALKHALSFAALAADEDFIDHEVADVARTFYNFLKGNK